MADKASRTIRIQWVRSGIGFPHRQKGIVRSLGLLRLNQVVERPDTPQIRGLVAKVSHLVSIVEESAVPAWESVAEYTVRPREVPPAETVAASPTETAEAEKAVPVESPVAEGGPELAPGAKGKEEPVELPASSAATQDKTPAERAAATEQAGAAKGAEEKSNQAEETVISKAQETS